MERNGIMRFSELLKSVMEDYGVNAAKLEDLLKAVNVDNISQKRISEYVRQISTPPFDKAQKMLTVMEYPISDDYLEASLALNRRLIKEDKQDIDSRGYNKFATAYVRFRNLIPGKMAMETETILLQRIKDLYSDESQFNQYVEDLISYDLEYEILGGEHQ